VTVDPRALLRRFAGLKIAVVGDLVADRYLLTEPSRLSREAPVLVVRLVSERLILGGAANAAHNLRALGAQVTPLGVDGADEAGDAVLAAFKGLGVATDGVVRAATYRTVAKTRILAGDPHRTKQQLLRVDREPSAPPDAAAKTELKRRVRELLGDADAVIYSDYGYETATDDVVAVAREVFRGRVQAADSRFRVTAFRGVTVATPNEDEASAAVGFPIRDEDALERAGRTLLERLDSSALLVTRGNQGMALFEPGKKRTDVPATDNGEVTDVSGAGDTVIAVFTLALAGGASYVEAMELANASAGVVVMKAGAATCSPEEFVAAAEKHAR
jgi:D-glycero-beta-D-manno-heptose-7-phosphate kinase